LMVSASTAASKKNEMMACSIASRRSGLVRIETSEVCDAAPKEDAKSKKSQLYALPLQLGRPSQQCPTRTKKNPYGFGRLPRQLRRELLGPDGCAVGKRLPF
jgi:hypothetical protein